jgi:thiazole synthase
MLIGSPSDAAKAMELGADAVLVNTAIAAAAGNLMAEALEWLLLLDAKHMKLN